jgi:hypothetical protein
MGCLDSRALHSFFAVFFAVFFLSMNPGKWLAYFGQFSLLSAVTYRPWDFLKPAGESCNKLLRYLCSLEQL